MEPLSSQQEIICLIKDFPPSCSLGQSEVLHQNRAWNDQGTLGLQRRATVASLPPFKSKRKIWLIPKEKCNTDPLNLSSAKKKKKRPIKKKFI